MLLILIYVITSPYKVNLPCNYVLNKLKLSQIFFLNTSGCVNKESNVGDDFASGVSSWNIFRCKTIYDIK